MPTAIVQAPQLKYEKKWVTILQGHVPPLVQSLEFLLKDALVMQAYFILHILTKKLLCIFSVFSLFTHNNTVFSLHRWGSIVMIVMLSLS
jgi:hypothetical protein